MEQWKMGSIGSIAGTLSGLRSMSPQRQALLLLRLLATQFAPPKSIGKMNFELEGYSSMLTNGFPPQETIPVKNHLLGAPWESLVTNGLIRGNGQGFFTVTDDGMAAAKNEDAAVVSIEILGAIHLLHSSLRGYGHYFHENKLKEAVAAAFEVYENRLNEIRDTSRDLSVRSTSGGDIVYKLFQVKKLRLPYSKLGSNSRKAAYEKSFTGLLSGGVGWIRNAYTHEKHQLPELKPEEALELLFVASYMLRMIDYSHKTKR